MSAVMIIALSPHLGVETLKDFNVSAETFLREQ